ncbi:MAG: ATP-binding protein [Candidatus Hydrogenedentes bacterium]|nr:ATP-binding protein [Candidatus Hydrogenedentota bacterium]
MSYRKNPSTFTQVYEAPYHWLWIVGIARIFVLLIVFWGAYYYFNREFLYYVIPIYATAFVLSCWHLWELFKGISRRFDFLLWAQMFVDFGVVCTTIGVTEGYRSPLTFMLVIVIMEAGFLLGIYQGFVFAIFSILFMGVQFYFERPHGYLLPQYAYTYLIQSLSFLFTGFISGYWNQRVNLLKQFHQDILNNMNSGFIITDRVGLVRMINFAGCRILEIEEADVIGKPIEDVMRPVSGMENPLRTSLRTHRDFSSYEFYIVTPTGKQKLLGLTTNRLTNAKGNELAIIASFTDLSELDKIRRDLKQHERLVVIGEQLSGLAHEIRTPVASIRGAVAELKDNVENPEVLKRLVEIVVRECDRLNYIVTSFLNFAKSTDSTWKEILIYDLVSRFVEQFKKSLPESPRYEIILKDGEEVRNVVVRGEEEQLIIVFQNIAKNAIEAMVKGGRLFIGLQLRGDKGPVEIHFSDEGPGIPPDKVLKIFEPFYTGKKQGLGMGLSVSLRIINSHNGNIQVVSNPNKGATFIIQLPVYRRV